MAKKITPPLRNSPLQQHTEVRGFLTLVGVVLAVLSLATFDDRHFGESLIGTLGHLIGGTFHFAFGLGSYLLLMYVSWVGVTQLLNQSTSVSRLHYFYFGIFLISCCILANLIEDSYPVVKKLGGVPYTKTLKVDTPLLSTYYAYHLGGSPLYFLYHNVPVIGLERLLNKTGTAILFSSLLILSTLMLANTSFISVFRRVYTLLLPRPKKEPEPASSEVAKPSEPLSAPLPKMGLLKYIKAKSAELRQRDIKINPEIALTPVSPDTELDFQPPGQRKSHFEEPDWTAPKLPPRQPSATQKTSVVAEPKVAKSTMTSATTPTMTPTKKPVLKLSKDAQAAPGDYSHYKLPPPSLLTEPPKVDQTLLRKGLKRQAELLEETLLSFGIEAKVGQINCGPTITSFEVHPAVGVKVQKIKTLENDIALNMEARSLRIIAPIPGKAAVGIEIPNPLPQEVGFKEILMTYQKAASKMRIPILLGKAVNGDLVMSDLTKMPHCIIAGATGSGKSVCINTLIMSILMTATPDEIKLLMVDPKKVELTPYTLLPHMIAPVITEPHEAHAALNWLVKEMEQRYEMLKQVGVRNLEGFNQRKQNPEVEANLAKTLNRTIPDKLPYMIAIIDELADLMMVASHQIETPIARIAQMARAVGIHLILATQRPSREVITGLIKANFPTRIAFKVASRINSQIILDDVGAETLLGNGDMLFLPPGTSHLVRAQGAYIRDDDINKVIAFICEQAPPNYLATSFESFAPSESGASKRDSGPLDSLYNDAHQLILRTGNASTTFLQRKLKIGYARAASLMDQLETEGVVGPAEGSKPRKILAACDNFGSEPEDHEL